MSPYGTKKFLCRVCEEPNKVKIGKTFLEDCCENPLVPVLLSIFLAIASTAAGLTISKVYGPEFKHPKATVEYITINGSRYKVKGIEGGERLELEQKFKPE